MAHHSSNRLAEKAYIANEYLSKFNGVCSPPAAQEEWNDWLSASKTRNYLLDDPLLDWLDLYGRSHGYSKDDDLRSYDSRTDFTRFILDQGERFEAAVVDIIKTRADVVTVAT